MGAAHFFYADSIARDSSVVGWSLLSWAMSVAVRLNRNIPMSSAA